MTDLTTEIAAPPQPGTRLPQALSENRNAENAPLPEQLKAAWNRVITSSLQSLAVQAARNKVASAACTAALQAARNKIARLEDMDHQLRGELQRVVGQRDDWSARSSRLEKEVDNLHAQLTLLEAETHLPSSPMASPRSSECGAVVHRMSVERRNMQGELLRLQRRDEVQTGLLEELRAQLLAATGDKAGSQAVLQPAEPSAEVSRLQRQEAALRAELSKAEYASARQAAQLLELQGTAEQHAKTAAELAQAQGALKAQLSKQDAAASAAAARIAELQAQLNEEQAGAAEQRAILQQLRWHLRGSAGTGMQEGADQQTLAAEVVALVRQQQEESQQQLAEQGAAAAEQAAQFETALKQQQQAAASASAAKLEGQADQLKALLKQQERQNEQAIAKLEAQLEKEKAEHQAAADALAQLDAQLSDRASEQQAAAASAAELDPHLEKEAERQAAADFAAMHEARHEQQESKHQAAAAVLEAHWKNKECVQQQAAAASVHLKQGCTQTGSIKQAAAGSSSSPLMPAGSPSSVAEQAGAQSVVAALKESLSHYKAAAQMAHERVLELEGQRAAADKQWQERLASEQERLASEQASSQQHHLRAGRMEGSLVYPLTDAGGTHGTPIPEGDPASASCVGLPGLRQSSSEGAGDYQLHRQVNAETKARKRAESCSAAHAASSAKLHLECIALTRSNKQLNVDNQRLELQLLAAKRTLAAATEQHEVAQVGDTASRQLLDLPQIGGSARKEPRGSMQQRSGSATSSPHTCPPHARSRSDGDSLHSLQLVTPSSSDRERPTTPSSSASSEQARLHGSNAGSHQGTARVLCLTPDGAAGPAKGSRNEATQDPDAGATSPHTSTASAGSIQGKGAAAQGKDGLPNELNMLQSHLAEVQGELCTCRQELHSQGEAAQEQWRRLEQRSSKLEVKLSKARQQAEARAAEVSATQMVSAGLQSKLEEIEKSQQAGLLHPAALLGQLFNGAEKQVTKLRVQVGQMTAELQAAESQLQASHQQLASLRRLRFSQQGQRSSSHVYSQFLISVLLGIAAILVVNYLHA
eukprot:jgi/Astpho2/4578/fgenesh1_pg.00067_%23_119_t